MEYLYPPLVDITSTPKNEVIKIVRINTIEKRFKAKEMKREEYDIRMDCAVRCLPDPEIVQAPVEEEPIEEPLENSVNLAEKKEIKVK